MAKFKPTFIFHITHIDNLASIVEDGCLSVMSKKMAEFLVHDWFPGISIERIGVVQQSIADEVQQILANADHKPQVIVKRDWYY